MDPADRIVDRWWRRQQVSEWVASCVPPEKRPLCCRGLDYVVPPSAARRDNYHPNFPKLHSDKQIERTMGYTNDMRFREGSGLFSAAMKMKSSHLACLSRASSSFFGKTRCTNISLKFPFQWIWPKVKRVKLEEEWMITSGAISISISPKQKLRMMTANTVRRSKSPSGQTTQIMSWSF